MKRIILIFTTFILVLVTLVSYRNFVLQSEVKPDFDNERKQFAEQVRKFKENGEIQVVNVSKYDGTKTYKTVSSNEIIIAVEISIKPASAAVDLDDLQIFSEDKKMLGYGWPEINLDDSKRDKNFKQQSENAFVVLFVVPQSFTKGFLAYSDKIFTEINYNILSE